MQIQQSTRDGCTIIALTGHLDHAATPHIQQLLLRRLPADGNARVEVAAPPASHQQALGPFAAPVPPASRTHSG